MRGTTGGAFGAGRLRPGTANLWPHFGQAIRPPAKVSGTEPRFWHCGQVNKVGTAFPPLRKIVSTFEPGKETTAAHTANGGPNNALHSELDRNGRSAASKIRGKESS